MIRLFARLESNPFDTNLFHIHGTAKHTEKVTKTKDMNEWSEMTHKATQIKNRRPTPLFPAADFTQNSFHLPLRLKITNFPCSQKREGRKGYPESKDHFVSGIQISLPTSMVFVCDSLNLLISMNVMP